TLSTGGFSTKNASVAYWNGQPIIQYISIVFMFLAGTNLVLSYFAVKGKVQEVFKDEEFKFYFKFIAAFTIIAALIIYFKTDPSLSSIEHPMVWGKAESAFRHSLLDRKSTRLNSSHVKISYAVFCLKKKKNNTDNI